VPVGTELLRSADHKPSAVLFIGSANQSDEDFAAAASARRISARRACQ
jgi:hypothetical protein